MQPVLQLYGLDEKQVRVIPFGNGLINHTWKVTAGERSYILQKINRSVFKAPEDIDYNINLLTAYLRKHAPEYFFPAPLLSIEAQTLVLEDGDFYRLLPFVEGSHAKDVVLTPQEAYEAARQFGKFTRMCNGLSPENLKITIPDFHNISRRYHDFLMAAEKGNRQRINATQSLINEIKSYSVIADEYEKLKSRPAFHLRVTHHDTKISNVLFDQEGKGICVIDLDTVMAGYFFSDVGDMMRTYLSPVSEEEKDVSKIEVREEFFHAIVKGYLSEMKDIMSPDEKASFFYAGQFMIYMQALRFMADYLNNDVYYGTSYEEHNLVRAVNQLTLLNRLTEKEKKLS